ncbi:TPA_asm: hypothetical protein G0E33_10075 [Salmonella enterica]|nr:hypothetical protein [Salmonella enterica]
MRNNISGTVTVRFDGLLKTQRKCWLATITQNMNKMTQLEKFGWSLLIQKGYFPCQESHLTGPQRRNIAIVTSCRYKRVESMSLSVILCNCHRIKDDRSGGHRTR